MSLTILSEPGIDPRTLPLKEKIRLVRVSNGLLIDLLEEETIGGHLNLEGCTSLIHLPDNIKIKGWLNLRNCTSLTHLPDNLEVGEWLDIYGCTLLKELPKTLKVKGFIFGGKTGVSIPRKLRKKFTGNRFPHLADFSG